MTDEQPTLSEIRKLMRAAKLAAQSVVDYATGIYAVVNTPELTVIATEHRLRQKDGEFTADHYRTLIAILATDLAITRKADTA